MTNTSKYILDTTLMVAYATIHPFYKVTVNSQKTLITKAAIENENSIQYSLIFCFVLFFEFCYINVNILC